MDIRTRAVAPFVGVAVTSGVGLTALSYSNGYPILIAAAVGTVTAVVGVWAVITEP